MSLPLALLGGSYALKCLWAAGDVTGPSLMAMSPQGTVVLTVTAMDQDTGVNDNISYIITSE